MTNSPSSPQTSLPAPPQAPPKTPQWPSHNAPRVWFLTDGLTPIAVSLARYLLDHGDYVIAGVVAEEFASDRSSALSALMAEIGGEVYNERDASREAAGADEEDKDADADADADAEEHGELEEPGNSKSGRKRWRQRFRLVPFDATNLGQTQAAVATALAAFGRIDIVLLCRSSALLGTLEELSQSHHTLSLSRAQLETNFFAVTNVILTLLPSMRESRNGHIIALTGITAHLGTPGMGLYCASQWALEGYCDSLAYEVAPFNIKMTIVQPNLEIAVLTNRIVSSPAMQAYAPDENSAPLAREILGGLIDKIAAESARQEEGEQSASEILHGEHAASFFPGLPQSLVEPLVAETVFAVAAIGGHDNPPARHIVGYEGVASVKEKLKTVSEELEDFLAVSGAVDVAAAAGPTGLDGAFGLSGGEMEGLRTG